MTVEPSKASKAALELAHKMRNDAFSSHLSITDAEVLAIFIDHVDRVACELHRQIIGIVPDSLLDGELLSSLMLPEPDPDPDPLEDALTKAWQNYKQQPDALRREAGKIMQALTAAGYEIRKVEP